MTMRSDSDVSVSRVTTSGEIYSGPTRVVGLHYLANATTAGTITLRDGGATGEILAVFDTPGDGSASDVGMCGPLRFKTNVYAELTSVAGVTVIYN